jgi:hypothetical protein
MAARLPAQAQRPPKPPDLVTLRRLLSSAVINDFEITKDEFKQRSNASGGGSYWLVHLKPKHSGDFDLTYRYSYDTPHYSHVEREFHLRVGPSGCRRGPPFFGSYSGYCLGDTIILPVIINGYSGHKFSLNSRAYTKDEEIAFDREPEETLVPVRTDRVISNPAADCLTFVGYRSTRSPYRSGGYTVELAALFEAREPGRFNLGLGSALPGRAWDNSVSLTVPIIVVARGTPVTLLASVHEVRGYDKGADGREWVSSVSGDSYMTEIMVLQPGDQVSFVYASSSHGAREERARAGKRAQEAIPVITRLPFSVTLEHDFSEWLVDYLPNQ